MEYRLINRLADCKVLSIDRKCDFVSGCDQTYRRHTRNGTGQSCRLLWTTSEIFQSGFIATGVDPLSAAFWLLQFVANFFQRVSGVTSRAAICGLLASSAAPAPPKTITAAIGGVEAQIPPANTPTTGPLGFFQSNAGCSVNFCTWARVWPGCCRTAPRTTAPPPGGPPAIADRSPPASVPVPRNPS